MLRVEQGGFHHVHRGQDGQKADKQIFQDALGNEASLSS
jgi:hypothetical protein